MGRPLAGVYIPAGAGPFPAVLFHKTAEMALGFESNVVKKDKYGENGFKMAKIGQKRSKISK